MTIVSTLVLYLICHGAGNVSLVFHTAFGFFFLKIKESYKTVFQFLSPAQLFIICSMENCA